MLLSFIVIEFLGGKDQIKYMNSLQVQLLLGWFSPLHLFLVLDTRNYVLWGARGKNHYKTLFCGDEVRRQM